MLRKPFALTITLAGVVSLGACSDGTDLDGTLTEDEAGALAEVLFAQTYASSNTQGSPAADAMQRVPYGPVTAPCPLGGSLVVSGEIESSQGEVTTIEYTVTQVHEDCQVRSERIDQVFTLNGDPNLTLDYSWIFGSEGGFEVDGGMNGNLQWETDGRAGACSVAVEFSVDGSFTQETGSGSVTGSVCGVEVTQETTVS